MSTSDQPGRTPRATSTGLQTRQTRTRGVKEGNNCTTCLLHTEFLCKVTANARARACTRVCNAHRTLLFALNCLTGCEGRNKTATRFGPPLRTCERARRWWSPLSHRTHEPAFACVFASCQRRRASLLLAIVSGAGAVEFNNATQRTVLGAVLFAACTVFNYGVGWNAD